MIPWWKKAVIYQIYPRSFQDSNDDGVGDLNGIISRLDYLQKLGIDAIWLSPIYQSPGIDNGYDISDYRAIDPQYGTMSDFDNLIAQAKKRNIRIIMDLVVNHTSDQHQWFIEARKSKNSSTRDFYIWRDPINGHEPNNLTSYFSGSAWKFDRQTQQYYLHFFAEEQPDLNWANPHLRQEIYDMMNFWLDKGISGFRMDAIELIGKDPDHEIGENGPNLHPYLQEMNQQVLSGRDTLTVGESWGANLKIAQQYSDPERHELSMIFQFEDQFIDQQFGKSKWDLKPFKISDLKKVLLKWQTELDYNHAWNSLFWENHDIPRVISRWGNDNKYRIQSAKMFAIILHLMRGTPYIYNGEEIGMTNCPINNINEVADLESINIYNERLKQGYKKKALIAAINAKGRDNARRPMQWSNHQNAGFSSKRPWLAVNPNYKQINVKDALNDPNSIFYTYQKLISLRHRHAIVINGTFTPVVTNDHVLAYYRRLNKQRWLIVANLGDQKEKFTSQDHIRKVLISNYIEPKTLQDIILRPYEAFAVTIQ
jgi:glucan 1,6-alpha-glucosidase